MVRKVRKAETTKEKNKGGHKGGHKTHKIPQINIVHFQKLFSNNLIFFLALLTDCTYSRSLTICCIFLNKNSKLFPKLSSSGLIGCLLHKLYGSAGKTKSSVYKVPTTKSTFEEELDWIGYGSL